MDKFLIFVFWIYSILGTILYSEAYFFQEGRDFQKRIDNEKLQQANQVIAGSLYEVQE